MEKIREGRRMQHLRVPVFPDEKSMIEENAKRTGHTVASFLREVGQGYKVNGIVDYQQVRELVRVNGDLGRLGGLLKLWLTDDPRTVKFGEAHIRVLLDKIDEAQAEMRRIMDAVLFPRKE